MKKSIQKLQGGIINAYGESVGGSNKAKYYTMDLKLVLKSGEVDLSENAVTVSIIVGHNNMQDLTYNSSITSIDTMKNASDNQYGIEYYNEDTANDLLEPNEIARIFITMSDSLSASANTDITIIIMSDVATLKIAKTIPIGLQLGSNLI